MEAVVIGAGVIGAACARELAARGHRVTVLERFAVASGTSSRCEGNILISDKIPGPEFDLTVESLRLWPGVVGALTEQLGPRSPDIEFEAKGGLVVATTTDGAGPLEEFAARQRAAGVDARQLTPREALVLEPHLDPEITAAVHYPQDCQVQPTITTEALLASARAYGGRVLTEVEVTGAERGSGGQVSAVFTRHGRFPADVVVNACGPWAGEVADRLGVHLPVLPRHGTVLVTTRMPHRIFHKVYDADYVGATQAAAEDLMTSSVIESTAAGTVLIGSSRQRIGFDDRLDVEVLRAIATKAVRIFPFLADQQILRSYAGFRPYMPDHLPVIGPDPRLAGLFHATGHEGAGIGLSVATATLLADLVDGRTPAVDPTAFGLDRTTLASHLREVA